MRQTPENAPKTVIASITGKFKAIKETPRRNPDTEEDEANYNPAYGRDTYSYSQPEKPKSRVFVPKSQTPKR